MATQSSLKPAPSELVLSQHFLDIRCRILDLAAQLDRLQRGGNPKAVEVDPKWDLIRKGLALLTSDQPMKAKALQELFSIPYDPQWEKPKPRF